MPTGQQTIDARQTAIDKLSKRRWLTPNDLNDCYYSELIGKLIKDGFMPKYSGSWGDWPPEYVAIVTTYATAKLLIQEEFKQEAKKGLKTDPADKLTDFQLAKARKEEKEMQAFFYANQHNVNSGKK